MQVVAIAAAVLVTAGMHYLFSYQRFTLLIARRHANTRSETTAVQVLLSPTVLGLAGWVGSAASIAVAAFLWIQFAWWVGAFYLAVQFVGIGLLPLLPLRRHFANIAQRSLERQYHAADPAFAAALMIDVIRSGGPHSLYPS